MQWNLVMSSHRHCDKLVCSYLTNMQNITQSVKQLRKPELSLDSVTEFLELGFVRTIIIIIIIIIIIMLQFLKTEMRTRKQLRRF
jgi:hypothetical protein